MRDVRKIWWLGLPIACLLAGIIMAMVDPRFYGQYLRKHEIGAFEHGTVVCALGAALLGGYVLFRRRDLPSRWVTCWVLLVSLGALYFGGEEASWGQNYFHWATPQSWTQVNDQFETNLHNTTGWLDQVPRGLLTAGTVVCTFVPFIIAFRRRTWDSRTNTWAWIWPTGVVVPTAAIAFLAGIPQKILATPKGTGPQGNIPGWFHEMFLGGRHNEMQEFFFAMFMLVYLWSVAARLRSLPAHECSTPSQTLGRAAA